MNRTDWTSGIENLWKQLPKSIDPIWNYTNKESLARKREGYELLAGALWHLELAAKFNGLTNQGRNKPVSGLPTWIEKKGIPLVTVEDELLKITYPYNNKLADNDGKQLETLIQNMLITDAGLRISGAREMINDHLHTKCILCNCDKCGSKNHSVHPFLAPRKVIGKWIKNELYKKNSIEKSVILITCLRDEHVHGEVSSKSNNHIWKFRETTFRTFSMSENAQACKDLWLELVEYLNSTNRL